MHTYQDRRSSVQRGIDSPEDLARRVNAAPEQARMLLDAVERKRAQLAGAQAAPVIVAPPADKKARRATVRP